MKESNYLKNRVFIVDDMDTVLLNVDETTKSIKSTCKTKKKFIRTRKKIKIYEIKLYKVRKNQENHYLLTTNKTVTTSI